MPKQPPRRDASTSNDASTTPSTPENNAQKKIRRWPLLVVLACLGLALSYGNVKRVKLYVPVISMQVQVVEVDLLGGASTDEGSSTMPGLGGFGSVGASASGSESGEDDDEEADLNVKDEEAEAEEMNAIERSVNRTASRQMYKYKFTQQQRYRVGQEFLKSQLEIEHKELSPPEAPASFKFYVYEQFNNSQNPLSPYYLADKVKKNIRKLKRNAGNCQWGLAPCRDDGTAFWLYGARRNNAAGDVVLADLFLRHPMGSLPHTPFASRTEDPSQADVFIVPYASDTHCKTIKFDVHCKDPRMDALIPKVLKSLEYFSQDYSQPLKQRHLFFSSTCYSYGNKDFISSVPMRTTIGGMRKKSCQITDLTTIPNATKDTSPWLCPDFVIPYLNQYTDYQPPLLEARPEEWWTTRQRNIALAAVFGPLKLCCGKRAFRNEFLKVSSGLFPNNTLAGMPVQIGSMGKERNIAKEQATFELYQDTIFCLILPGDGPAQKRFFDVIMSGCIPVVFVFDRWGVNNGVHISYESRNSKDPSWWDGLDKSIPKWNNVRVSYPFAKGIYPDQPDVGIDYEELVVQIRPNPNNGCDFACGHEKKDCQWDCLVPQLEALLKETPQTEIIRLRKNLRKASTWFAFGLQENSYRTYDAFAVLLSQLGHKLQRMKPLQDHERAPAKGAGEEEPEANKPATTNVAVAKVEDDFVHKLIANTREKKQQQATMGIEVAKEPTLARADKVVIEPILARVAEDKDHKDDHSEDSGDDDDS